MSRRRTVAMVANDHMGCLTPHGAWAFIASMLAPTVEVLAIKKSRIRLFFMATTFNPRPYRYPHRSPRWALADRDQV